MSTAIVPPAVVSGRVQPVEDRYLTDTEIEAARSTLAECYPDEEQVLLAFVSGSLAAGLGHRLSDVDVHVLTRPGVTTLTRSYPRDGHIVQITAIDPVRAGRIVKLTAEFRATSGDRRQLELADDELALAIRLAIGTTLICHGIELAPAEQRCQTMRRVVLARGGVIVGSYAEDVLSALDGDDVMTALRASALALEVAVDAALAACGDMYYGPKFLYRRLARSPVLADLLPTIWALLNQPAWPPAGTADTHGLVHSRLDLAAYLLGVASLDGWDGALRSMPRWRQAAGAGPRRSPWACPIRYRNGLGLGAPDAGFRVTEGMVRLWLALDGRPRPRLVDDVRKELPGFGDLSADQLGAVIDKLVDAGVAVQEKTEDDEGGDRYGA